MPHFSSFYNNPNAGFDLVFKTLSSRFAKTYELAPITHDMITTVETGVGLEVDYSFIGESPMPREWKGDRHFKELETYKYKIESKSYESTLRIKMDDLQYGQLAKYGYQVDDLAKNAKYGKSALAWKQLLLGFTQNGYDGVPFFSDNHPVTSESGGGDNNGGGAGDPWFIVDLDAGSKPIIMIQPQELETVVIDAPDSMNMFMRREVWFGTHEKYGFGYGRWQYAYGSKQTLDQTNFMLALAARAAQKNANGLPMVSQNTVLLTGTKLLSNVLTLLEAGLVGGW